MTFDRDTHLLVVDGVVPHGNWMHPADCIIGYRYDGPIIACPLAEYVEDVGFERIVGQDENGKPLRGVYAVSLDGVSYPTPDGTEYDHVVNVTELIEVAE